MSNLETEYDLNVSQTDTTDSNGRTTMIFSPAQFSEKWQITHYTCTATSAGGSLTVYRNAELPGYQKDFTRKVENDISDMSIELMPGERLIFVWAGTRPGTIVTAAVMGKKIVKGRRSY